MEFPIRKLLDICDFIEKLAHCLDERKEKRKGRKK
jgi:hypothetical protein